jgi:UPF0755 protein
VTQESPPRSAGSPLWRRLLITAGSAFATVCVFLMLGAVVFLWVYQGPGPKAVQGDATTVILRQGAGLSEIASTLRRAHVIGSAAMFEAATQLTHSGRRLKAGEYEIPSGAPMSAVIDKIRRGDIVHHMVTVPEGLTSEQVVDILMANPVLTGAAPVPDEGAILPETYEVRRGEDRAAVLQRMMDAHDILLRGLWAQRRSDLPLTSPEQAVILASIVEKETGVASERPRVAAVFVNRLQKGIKLQSDPTIVYGLTRGKPLGHGIRASELASQTPYNTYQIAGLPPTPICNPGRASIAATLDPPRTNDLFFVATGGGKSSFASSLDEHNRNVGHLRDVEHAKAAAATRAGAAGLR